jgi:cobaltochelatase CobN
MAFACIVLAQSAWAEKVAVLSTGFVLERKFKLMEESARKQGIDLAWTQVDREGEAGVRRVLKDASLVIVDAPRSDDQAAIERVGGKLMRDADLPTVGIQVMSPPNRLKPARIDLAQAQRLYDYYVGGTRRNHERMFQFLKVLRSGGDLAAVPPPFSPAWPTTWPGRRAAAANPRWNAR